jgi:alpha-tubulin suppressor-like RCC1 family protein
VQHPPAARSYSLAFRQVSAGDHHTCGVTTTDVVYCWGGNDAGQLGDGTTTERPRPVRVVGGLAFRSVDAGGVHTCGLTTDHQAYCWGDNGSGQLGHRTRTGPELCGGFPCSTRPVRVAGRLPFQQVSAGSAHSCGVATGTKDGIRLSHVAYCWGRNIEGELGVGTSAGPETCTSFGEILSCSSRPVRVVGGLAFRSVDAGGVHTCGVTTSDVAYCWGIK